MPRKITIELETARYFLAVEKAFNALEGSPFNRQALTGYDVEAREMHHVLMHTAFDLAVAKPEYRPRKMTRHTRGIR